MSRYNVEYNGKWACFSTIIDDFITKFMSKQEYEKWRLFEYDKNNEPIECSNIQSIKDSAFSICLNRSHYEGVECLKKCGLSETESEKIIYDMETEHYCPISKDNGDFECPNCHKKIKREQKTCDNKSCCIEFIWR